MTPTDSADERPLVVVRHKDPIVQLGLVEALSRSLGEGAVVDSASRSMDAHAEFDSAAVAVTDYTLGLELCRRTSADTVMSGRARPRILIVTHRDGESEVRSAMDAGASGYMLDGCRLDELVHGVSSVLGGRKFLCRTAASRMADSLSRDALSAREMQVLRCLARGQVNRQIGAELDIALGTVKAHLKSILSKLDVSTRTQAVCVATQRGLLGDVVDE